MSKKPTPKANKKYAEEFKSDALKLAERLSVAEAAEKLGIYASQIYSWSSALNIAVLASKESRSSRSKTPALGVNWRNRQRSWKS